MPKLDVYYRDQLAGWLSETDEGYLFEYSGSYRGPPVSLSLPLDNKTFTSRTLFSFFDGLIPEGWVLDLVHEVWKVNPRDRMKLLEVACRDPIGAVSIGRGKSAAIEETVKDQKSVESGKCFHCARPVKKGLYHTACAKYLFGSSKVPFLPYSATEVTELAKKTIRQQITVTGVQPKISLGEKQARKNRLTISGFQGKYIFKPPYEKYPDMVQNEHLTMLLAKNLGLPVVPFGLIPMADGILGYISRRIDRNEEKIHMEDMCQLSGRLSEDKYKGSHEQIGRIIRKYSHLPERDIRLYYELVIFCFLTGNSDMHLKNFSLWQKDGIYFSPAYDLLNTKLILPEDREELALMLDGKKNNFKKASFIRFAGHLNIDKNTAENIIKRLLGQKKTIENTIRSSFLPEEKKKAYLDEFVQKAVLLK